MRQSGRLRAGVTAALIGALLTATVAPSALARDTVIIKMATAAPDGTIWHKALMEMGEEWKHATGGAVTLRVYAGGVAGDESATVRKMRIGQLDAATLTVAGLAEIDQVFQVLGMPLFYDSYEELDQVLEAIEPTLQARLEAKGYVFLAWAYAGWAYFFSTQPVHKADDLRRMKIFTSAGEDRMVQLYKDNGFRPVALSPTDILVGLETGMIEALPTPPLAALLLQWFRSTPYMLDEGLAPVVGCVVASRQGWNKVPATEQRTLLRAAEKLQKRLRSEVPVQDRRSLEEMQSRGLTVVQLDGDRGREWRAMAHEFADKMRGTLVPRDIFDAASKAREAYRARSTGAGGSD